MNLDPGCVVLETAECRIEWRRMTVFKQIWADQHGFPAHPLADSILLSLAGGINEIGDGDESKCPWRPGVVDRDGPRGCDGNGAAGEHQPGVLDLGVHSPEFFGYAEGQAAVELPIQRRLVDQLLVANKIVRIHSEVDEPELIQRCREHVQWNGPLLLSGRHGRHKSADHRRNRGSLAYRLHQDRIVFRLPLADANHKMVIETNHFSPPLRRPSTRLPAIKLPENHEFVEMFERSIVDGQYNDVRSRLFPAHQKMQVACLQME